MATTGYSTTFNPGTENYVEDLYILLSSLSSGWTVESPLSFRDATSYEYSAWTVHQSGHDFLFIAGVGSGSQWNNCMGFSNSYELFNESDTGYKNISTSSQRFIAVGYHPEGGYTNQLYTQGYVPHNGFSPFWDVSHNQGGLGSDMWAFPWIDSSQSGTSFQWHLIEDDTDPIISLKYYTASTLSEGIIDILGGAIIDNSWPTSSQSLSSGGLMRISHDKNGGASNPPQAKKDLIVYGKDASELDDFYVNKETDFARRGLLDHAADNFPDVNSKVLTADIPLEIGGTFSGYLDSSYFREIPNDGDTYHDVIRPTNPRPLLSSYEKIATMWDNSLTL